MSKRIAIVACVVWSCSRSAQPSPTEAASSAGAALVAVPSAAPTTSATASAGAGGTVASGAPAAAAPGSVLSIVPTGRMSGLSLEPEAVSYCDSRGGRMWNPATGAVEPQERKCPVPKDESRNSDCGEIEIVADIRAPGGNDDTIYFKGAPTVNLHGRIHDCAYDSGVLLVATGQEIVAIDVKTGHRDVRNKDGGGQVAINAAWLAWSDCEKVFAQHR